MEAVAHGWHKPGGGGPSREIAQEVVAADKKAGKLAGGGFAVHTEKPTHFLARGRDGKDFKIAKGGLSPARVASYQRMCRGGEVDPKAPRAKLPEPPPPHAEMGPPETVRRAQQSPPPPRVPRMVPLPGKRSGGDTILPTEMIAPDEELYVDAGGNKRVDPAYVRKVMDAAASAWGAKPQDWKGLEVHFGTEIPGESERAGRTLVRKSQSGAIGGRMDVRYDGQGDVAASSLAHEVGHLILGGDPEHKDRRWGSRKFWRDASAAMGKALGGRVPDLDPYRVDWNGYAQGGEVEGGNVYQLHHEDEDAFHVRHPDGSIVQLAKKGTPAHILKAVALLPKYAEGGEVEQPKPPEKPEEHAAGWNIADRIHAALPEFLSARPPIRQHNERLEAADRAARDEGAPAAPKMAEGGEARPSGLETPKAAAEAEVPLPVEPPTVLSVPADPAGLAPPLPPESFPAGGQLPGVVRQVLGQGPAGAMPGELAAAPDTASPTAAVGVPPALERPPELQPPPGASAASVSGAALPPLPAMPGYPSAELERQIGEMTRTGREGAELQARAQTQQSQEMAAAYQQHLKLIQDTETRRQADLAGVQQEINAAVRDVQNQHIDPGQFWSSRSTGQKVSAMVGMLLGGIGSGLTGQPNAAVQVIQRQIDRDIDAQKAELGKKENLVTQLYRKYGNVEEAAAAARSYLTASIAGQANLIAARSGNLQAQATAKFLESHLQGQAIGPMAQIVNGKYQAALTQYQLQWQQRMMQWTMQQANGGGAQDPGYVPSSNHPMLPEPSLKGIAEQRKAQDEQRIDWTDANGARRWTFGKPGQAKDANEGLAELGQVRADIADLKKIASQASAGVLPWTAVRAKWDAIQGHFAMLSPNALSAVKRMSETELGIGKKESGESIWRTKLNGGAALDATAQLLQRRQDAILRSHGVDERFLGAGGPQGATYLTAPVR